MKTLLLTAFISVSIMATGQITINNTHIAPLGSIIPQATDTLPAAAITPGSAGPGQTWNFTTLGNDFTDTMKFVKPDWLSNGQYFPSSNIGVQYSGQTTEGFLLNTSTELSALGQAGDFLGTGSSIAVKVNPKEKIMIFPATYNTAFSDSFFVDITADGASFGVDSVRLKSHTRKDVVVDAWGTLTTPVGTYNTLRSYTEAIVTDSVWVYYAAFQMWALVSDSYDTTYSYTWWTNSSAVGFPLVEMDYEQDSNFVPEVRWLSGMPVSTTSVNEATATVVKVFPNPAVNTVSVSVPNHSGRFYVQVSDMSGREVSTWSGEKNAILNVARLSAGTYLVRVTGDKINAVETIQIVR